MKKPVIGIVAKYKKDLNTRQNAFIRDEIKNAIISNGGIAIGILSSETEISFTPTEKDAWKNTLTKQQKQDLMQQIEMCDGIILQGGDSSLTYESWIAKYCYDNNIPTLGICAGQNAMVRALGGTTKKVQNPQKHNQPWVDDVHLISIHPKTKFFNIIKQKELMVNSRHKKVVDKLPHELAISAVDDDGNIEVVESPTKDFYIAVRFHPETLYGTNKKHNEIFKQFLNFCKH